MEELNMPVIYVYGAGMVAELLLNVLKQQNHTKVEACLVSDTPNAGTAIQGVPVLSVSENNGRYPIVIATLPNQHKIIAETLRMYGIEECFAVSETFFQEMRRQVVPERRRRAEFKLRLSDLGRMSSAHEVSGTVVLKESPLFPLPSHVKEMSVKEFMESRILHGQTIFMPILPWESDWKQILKKAFTSADELLLSFRYGYLEDADFSLFQEAEAHGFLLSAANRFLRRKEEYGTDVILLCFRKALSQEEPVSGENSLERLNRLLGENSGEMYDIGLAGSWSYPNYGAELTYFALYKLLRGMGYSVCMLEWAEDSIWKPYGCTQLFEQEPYASWEIADPAKNHLELINYNKQCKAFVQGSDQLLHPYIYHIFGKNIKLDWVDADKKKIGYALSFGHANVEYDLETQVELGFYLRSYDAVSVRENSGVTLMKERFEIDAEQVLDPVWLCDPVEYEKLADKHRTGGQGIFAYIVDPAGDTDMLLKKTADEMGMPLLLFHDALQAVDPTAKGLSVEKWLGGLLDSKLVIADSFHGICFAIFFHKRFLAIKNVSRGGTRFESILKMLQLQNRLFQNMEDALRSPLRDEDIDYRPVDKMLEAEREKSVRWLKDALAKEHSLKYSAEFIALKSKLRDLESMLYQHINA